MNLSGARTNTPYQAAHRQGPEIPSVHSTVYFLLLIRPQPSGSQSIRILVHPRRLPVGGSCKLGFFRNFDATILTRGSVGLKCLSLNSWPYRVRSLCARIVSICWEWMENKRI